MESWLAIEVLGFVSAQANGPLAVLTVAFIIVAVLVAALHLNSRNRRR